MAAYQSNACIQWSEEYECYTVNGVLAPIPLSRVPLNPDERIPEPAPGSPSRVNEQQPGVGDPSGGKIRHSMLFKLFKFTNCGEKYLLERYLPDTGVTTSYLVELSWNTTWAVSVTALKSRDHVDDVQLLSEDPKPPMFKMKYEDLTLAERLVGWTFRNNIRKDGKREKFYNHPNKQLRSFRSVVIFIIYANDAASELQLTEREAAAQDEES